MKTVIIISKCLRVTPISKKEMQYEFHFKGVCAGEIVKKIILTGSDPLKLIKGEEYLLYARLMTYDKGVLRGIIVKAKALDECWDKS